MLLPPVHPASSLLRARELRAEHVHPERSRLLRGVRMRPPATAVNTISLVSVLLVACGGDVFGPGDSGTDGGGGDGQPADSGGPFACGTSTCSGSELCIHPCCGGAMICAPRGNSGTCPPGLQISQTCPSMQPCSNVCIPAAPFCSSTTNNNCMPVQGHDCYELCQ